MFPSKMCSTPPGARRPRKSTTVAAGLSQNAFPHFSGIIRRVQEFARALWRHWASLMSGIVSLFIGISLRVVHDLGRLPSVSEVPDWVLMTFGVACLFWAEFRVWKDTHHELLRLRNDHSKLSKELYERRPKIRIVRYGPIENNTDLRLSWQHGFWLHNDGLETAYSVNIVDFTIQQEIGFLTAKGATVQAIRPDDDAFLPVFLDTPSQILRWNLTQALSVASSLRGPQHSYGMSFAVPLRVTYRDFEQHKYAVAANMNFIPLRGNDPTFEMLGPAPNGLGDLPTPQATSRIGRFRSTVREANKQINVFLKKHRPSRPS